MVVEGGGEDRGQDRLKFPAIVDARQARSFWPAIQSRMCSGRMSIIRIAPNSRIKCLPIM